MMMDMLHVHYYVVGYFPAGMFLLSLIAIIAKRQVLVHALFLPLFVLLLINLLVLAWVEPDIDFLRYHPSAWPNIRIVICGACLSMGALRLISKSKFFNISYFIALVFFASDCLLTMFDSRYVGP